MDGIPWQVVGAIATPLIGGVVWLGKKAWTLVEAHAERRTKAVEAIAPAIKASFDDVRKHVTEHSDEHVKTVQKVEQNMLAAVHTAKAEVIAAVGVSQRLERVEALVAVKAKDVADPTSPERPETNAVAPPSLAARHRPSRPAGAHL
jgi:uncharacterized membrane protein